MARIRSIHPGLATDEAFMLMSAYAKASWALLWGECDDQGIFEWKPVVLKARLLPADPIDFESLLAEWQRLGCVIRYEIGGRPYGAVRNFVRFQRPKSPKDTFASTDEVRKWVGFKEDGKRPSAGTGRPSTIPTSELLPNSPGTPSEIGAQMKEEGGNKKDTSLRSVAREAKPARRKTAIKFDWEPSEKNREDARHYGVMGAQLGFEAEKFRDHHLKNGSVFKDWNAAWRTWCQRVKEFQPRGTGPPQRPQTGSAKLVELLTKTRGYEEDDRRRDPCLIESSVLAIRDR